MPSRVLSNDNYKENGVWLLACFWFIKYDFYIMKKEKGGSREYERL